MFASNIKSDYIFSIENEVRCTFIHLKTFFKYIQYVCLCLVKSYFLHNYAVSKHRCSLKIIAIYITIFFIGQKKINDN